MAVLRFLSSDIGVTDVRDGQDAGAEVLAACRSEIQVVAGVVVDRGLAQGAVVLNLSATHRRAVAGDDHQLAATLAKGRQRLLRTKHVLAGLHHQLKLGVDRVHLRLGLLGHFCFVEKGPNGSTLFQIAVDCVHV